MENVMGWINDKPQALKLHNMCSEKIQNLLNSELSLGEGKSEKKEPVVFVQISRRRQLSLFLFCHLHAIVGLEDSSVLLGVLSPYPTHFWTYELVVPIPFYKTILSQKSPRYGLRIQGFLSSHKTTSLKQNTERVKVTSSQISPIMRGSQLGSSFYSQLSSCRVCILVGILKIVPISLSQIHILEHLTTCSRTHSDSSLLLIAPNSAIGGYSPPHKKVIFHSYHSSTVLKILKEEMRKPINLCYTEAAFM